jgi:GTP-binding protein
MRFIDEATIRIHAGHGGPGCISFRREKFIPRGGPDGGDGGKGGDISFVASVQLGTLQDFRFRREYHAPAGMHGSGSNKAGRDGEDIVIRVPVGTVIKDSDTDETLIDFAEDGQEWTACRGGRGGKGNAHFVSSTFQAPKFAQDGEEGQSLNLKLELKLIADAAIIGFPNAGKSTLISRISAARPKIADYAFTTLTPNLGVVSLPDLSSFVVADIPGLIEGAHKGYGLGHKFLKHIERTRVFIHLLDGTKFLEDATDLGDDSFERAVEELVRRYSVIRQELGLFNEALLHKPEIVVLNKLDVLDSNPELVEKARQALRSRIAAIRGTHPEPNEPYVVSAVAGTGMDDLLYTTFSYVKAHRIPKVLDMMTGLMTEAPSSITLPDDEKLRG